MNLKKYAIIVFIVSKEKLFEFSSSKKHTDINSNNSNKFVVQERCNGGGMVAEYCRGELKIYKAGD